jgi:Crinkler effector protein N-terminal domain
MSDAKFVELNCLILGDDESRIFVVKIEKTKTIASLKDSVKRKKSQSFHGIDANTLDLWKVSIPVNKHFGDVMADLGLQLEMKGRLSPVCDVAEVFGDTPRRKRLHIVVQYPRPGKLSRLISRSRLDLILAASPSSTS